MSGSGGAGGGGVAACGCRCIRCKSPDLASARTGEPEEDGYCDMHHTCNACGAHFDHLDGEVFEECEKCGYSAPGAS